MPHVIVKLWPGKSEQQKKRLGEAITEDKWCRSGSVDGGGVWNYEDR